MGKKSTPKPPPAPDPIKTAEAQSAFNRIDTYTPFGSQTYTKTGEQNGIPTYRSDINLTPQSQQLFNLQQGQDLSLGQVGNTLADRISQKINSPQGLFRDKTTGEMMDGIQTSADGGDIQRGLDFSGAPKLPGVDDFSGDRLRVEDALYSRLNPQFERSQQQLDAKLANQGIMPGSEAYKDAQDQLSRERNDARMQTVLAGGDEQSRLFGLGLNARQQAVGEKTTQGQFANSAQQQAFAQALANAGLNNQARLQNMNEVITARELPINELNALRGATQIQAPNFGPTQPVDVAGNIWNNFNAQQDVYNQRLASSNANRQALYSLGSGALMGLGMAFSDRRLKRDIRKIGKTPGGINVYEFRYRNDDTLHTGVMAQEVEKIIPSAVITRADGYKMVNYELVR